MSLNLVQQEIPFDHPESCHMFQPSAEKPFVATPTAIEEHQQAAIFQCLQILQVQAKKFEGLDYLQVFHSSEPGTNDLWFIEDGEGGAITALLPSDY